MTSTPSIVQSSSQKTNNDFEVPLIDFAPFLQEAGVNVGEPPTREQILCAAQIDSACRDSGFVCLKNCGVPHQLLNEAFRASKELFGLDETTKRTKLVRIKPETNTGYAPFGSESLNRQRGSDLKEAFNVRSINRKNSDDDNGGNDSTFLEGVPPSFASVSLDLWNAAADTARRYAKACAVALELEPVNYFEQHFQRMDLSTVRFLHYPPVAVEKEQSSNNGATLTATTIEKGSIEKKQTGTNNNDNQPSDLNVKPRIRTGEHTDFGLFTLLFIDGQGSDHAEGLQLKPSSTADLTGHEARQAMQDTEWRNVSVKTTIMSQDMDTNSSRGDAPSSAVCLVNTGALMARWTNNVWRATAHRVVVTEKSASGHRYSIACFYDPDASTICEVHEKFVNPGEQPKYPPISSLDFLLMKLRECQEQNAADD